MYVVARFLVIFNYICFIQQFKWHIVQQNVCRIPDLIPKWMVSYWIILSLILSCIYCPWSLYFYYYYTVFFLLLLLLKKFLVFLFSWSINMLDKNERLFLLFRLIVLLLLFLIQKNLSSIACGILFGKFSLLKKTQTLEL